MITLAFNPSSAVTHSRPADEAKTRQSLPHNPEPKKLSMKRLMQSHGFVQDRDTQSRYVIDKKTVIPVDSPGGHWIELPKERDDAPQIDYFESDNNGQLVYYKMQATNLDPVSKNGPINLLIGFDQAGGEESTSQLDLIF